jgi:hypothetical protein
MEPIAPGVHPVDLFAREYDIRSAWFGVLEPCALVYSGTVRVTTGAMLGVQLDPMVTIVAELLGSCVRLVPLIRTTKCTYRVTVVQRSFVRIRVHFGCHLKCRPEGSGIPGRAPLHLVPPRSLRRLCSLAARALLARRGALFQAGVAGGLATATE